MSCGSKCTCKKEEWNNGTIYRVFVQQAKLPESTIIDVPVDIAQSELTGKVLIGVENFCLDRRLAPIPDPATNYKLSNFSAQTDTLIENWANVQYIQLQSINLPPDIDFTAAEDGTGGNTQIFARIPLETRYKEKESGGSRHPMIPRVAGSFPLNKDGILYEMTNNPNALSNGRLRIQLVNNSGKPWKLNDHPIYKFQFTLVIYKPRNTYN